MKGLHIFDSEASGLLTEPNLYYHCVLFKEYAQPVFNLFLPPEHDGYEEAITWVRTHHNDVEVNIHNIDELATWLTTVPAAIACHNAFGYDLPLWRKLSGIEYDMFRDPKCMGTINDKQVSLYDTLSMSRTLWPDRPLPKGCPESVKNPVTGRLELVAPHGLMAWGYRVANKKVKIDDWRNQPLWEYVHRVWEDVIINELVWKELMDEMQCKGKFEDTAKFLYKDTPYGKQHKINWKNALRRGMLADYLMILQEQQGVWFNTEAAEKLCDRIDAMMKEIEEEVEPLLPPKPMSESQRPKFPSRPFNRDGSISSTGYKWLEKLGYPVDFSAFDYVAPPAKPFTSTGGLSAAGARWCLNEFGIEDPEKAREFLSEYAQKPAPQPLPDDLLEKAKRDLHDQKEPDFLIPMKLSNQDDIKRYLVNTAGWKPTMWRTKDVTKDSFKKERKDDVIHTYVESYLDDLDKSEYKYLILEHLRNTNEDFQITNRVYDGRKDNETREKKVFAAFRRLARALPTSPMLKDTFGHLCPNLEKIDADTAKKIVKWLSLRNRRGVLRPMNEKEGESKGWLNHPRLAVDHKLPAGSSGITNTGRRKHCVVCNVPKPSDKVLLGKEMRGLLGVDTTKYYEVGIDGSNLEQLIGAWGAYEFDDGLYYHTVSAGDAHAENAKAYTKAAGKEVSRGDGKPITYACLPKDTTTVLTRDGWREFKDLAVGLDVLTYNAEKGVSEWKPIQHVVEFDNQPVIKMENSHFEFESTADHRWFGDRRTGRKTRYYVQEFFTTEEFKGERRILRSAVAEGGGLCISPEEAGVLGWLVADGYFHWSGFKRNKGEGITARIVQCEKKYTEEIRQTLAGANISWSEHYSSDDRVDFLLCSKDIRKLFDKLPFGRVNKDEFPWAKLVLMLSQPARAAWLEAFYLAEGWTDRKGNKIICQNEGEYLEAVRLAIYLEGMVPVQHNHGRSGKTGYANKGICRNIRLSDRKFLTCQRLTKAVSRNADVFCLTTENSTFVARQGNHITITGNCLYGAQSPKIASMLDVSREIGQKVIDALWDANPGLKGRKEALEAFWEATGKKFIYGLDGRKLYARSRHSLLNLFQQNGGALLCDLVGILMHYQLIKRGWYDLGVRRIIYYHDEYQLQVPLSFRKFYYFDTIEALEAFKAEQEAKGVIFDGHKYKKERRDENGEKMVDKDGNQLYDPILNEDGKLTLMYCPVGEMVVKCFWQASKMLGVPFQITGEYLTGRSWGECH